MANHHSYIVTFRIHLCIRYMPFFFEKRGFLVSVVQGGHQRTQQNDRLSALQTSHKENTFHPHNHAVKSITPKSFKLLQNDSETGSVVGSCR